jgi:MFS family permease
MWASINTRVQTLVADDMLGRVMSLYAVAFFGGAPVGALLLGTLATLLGPIHAFALSGVGCLLCTLLFRRAFPRLEARARARERAPDPERTAREALDLP